VATIQEDYTPVFVGNTGTLFAPVFRHRDNTPVDLTGCTLSMKMELYQSIDSGIDVGTIKTCSGPWTITDAANGGAYYRYQTADVNTAGVWNLWIKITDAFGRPVHADDGTGAPKRLHIFSAP